MSAYGAGSLLGTGLVGMLPKPTPRRLGAIMLLDIGVLGIGMALLGLASSTPIAASITLLMGIVDGFAVILFITWLQVRTPPATQGRMMSLLMSTAVGLKPLCDAVAGVLIGVNVTLVFVGAGMLVTLMVFGRGAEPVGAYHGSGKTVTRRAIRRGRFFVFEMNRRIPRKLRGILLNSWPKSKLQRERRAYFPAALIEICASLSLGAT
jgi:hypothetical protein